MADHGRIALEVRARREAAKLSMAELSRRASLSPGYISKLEGGGMLSPRYSNLRAIARVLGCALADLTGEPDEKTVWDEALDRPRLNLAFALAARQLLPRRQLSGREIDLIDIAAEIYERLSREEREGGGVYTLEEALRRFVSLD